MTHTTSERSARGAAELVRFLEDHAYRHVFGLPGSSMVAALHELQNSAVRYVPTIHESTTIAAAAVRSRPVAGMVDRKIPRSLPVCIVISRKLASNAPTGFVSATIAHAPQPDI